MIRYLSVAPSHKTIIYHYEYLFHYFSMNIIIILLIILNLCSLFQGKNGTFRMYIEGDGGVFEVTPSQGINDASFLIRVKNPAKLDFEQTNGKF